jgi:anti-sigma B factor antagonist
MRVHIRLRYSFGPMTALLNLEKEPVSTETLTIYRANGKISLETVNDFIQRVRPEPAQHLVIDMSGVNFLDSAGVGALVSLFVNRRNHGKTFALAKLPPQASAVVTVAGLQKLLPIHQNVEEATAKLA